MTGKLDLGDGITLRMKGLVVVGGQGNGRSFNPLGMAATTAEDRERPRRAFSLSQRGLYAGTANTLDECLSWLRTGRLR